MIKNPIEQAGKWKEEECKTSKSYICQKNSGEFSPLSSTVYLLWLCQSGVKSNFPVFNPILTENNQTVSHALQAVL